MRLSKVKIVTGFFNMRDSLSATEHRINMRDSLSATENRINNVIDEMNEEGYELSSKDITINNNYMVVMLFFTKETTS